MRLPMWNLTLPNFGSSAHSMQPRASSAPPDTKLASNASILAAPQLAETGGRPYHNTSSHGRRNTWRRTGGGLADHRALRVGKTRRDEVLARVPVHARA